MNINSHPITLLSMLILACCVPLLWIAGALYHVWYSLVFLESSPESFLQYAALGLATVFFGGIAVVLLLLTLWLVGVVFGWRRPLTHNQALAEAYESIDRMMQYRGKERLCLQLLLGTSVISFHILFLQDALSVTLAWAFLLPLLVISAPYPFKSKHYPQMLLFFGLQLMATGQKISVLYEGSLVFFFAPLKLALLVTFPIVLLIIWLKVRRTGEQHWRWRLLLSLPITCFVAGFYTGPMLCLANIYLEKGTPNTYPAEVITKCPPFEHDLLRVEILYHGNRQEHLIWFQEYVYEDSEEGSIVNVLVYPGFLKMPWYNEIQDIDMHNYKRVYP
ncbi:hypothetical protein SAMN05216436_106138 [bacterium A37T11]|nr:hypothetical protein SAMN05216436_106138 [bacterium A37T11]